MLRSSASRFALLVLLIIATTASAADPREVAPDSLRKYFVTLADIVHAAGVNKIDRAIEHVGTEANPAFRNPDERAKFRDGLQKLFAQIGRIRPKFESYDVMAITQISSKAYTVHGVGNGERGPVHVDFDIFFYEGRWHMLGLHFNAGMKRDREIPARAIYFDNPVVLQLDQPEVAALK